MDYLILIGIGIAAYGIGYWIANRKKNKPPTSGLGGGIGKDHGPGSDPQVNDKP